MRKLLLLIFFLHSFSFSKSLIGLEFGSTRADFFNLNKAQDIERVKKEVSGLNSYSYIGSYHGKPAKFYVYFKEDRFFKAEALINVEQIAKTVSMGISVQELYRMEFMAIYYYLIKELGYPRGISRIDPVRYGAEWQNTNSIWQVSLSGDKNLPELRVINQLK